jgi:formyl-CoA transferase/CoA:oxalate CoA-transferase
LTAPLDGIAVLDFSSVLSGPFCTMLLADLGADVLKIERPGEGDDTRRLLRYAGRGPDDEDYFYAVNRNKRSVEIDLKCPEGLELARKLAQGADVLVENFRPGVADRLGLGWAELHRLNPALVYCSISGFGQSGPAAQRPGFDSVVQAFSGLMSTTGTPESGPTRIGTNIGDLSVSVYAAFGIVTALFAREKDGRGRWIDVSLFETMLALMQSHLPAYFATGQDPARCGNSNPNRVPSNTYRAADGRYLQVAANDRQWPMLCDVLGAPALASDPRFAAHAGRLQHRAAVDDELGRLFAGRGRAAWLEALEAAGIPAAPVNTLGEALADAQVAARDLLWSIEHPTSGTLRVLGTPLKLDDGEPYRPPRRRPPLLGEHTDEVLAERLGLGQSEIARLRERGAIGSSPASRAEVIQPG